MADSERMVGGLRCREVLERLSDYLEGDLAPAEVSRVQQHVRGCDWCERFGGQFALQVAELRKELAVPPPLDPERARRLRERLAAES
ncbi:MAG: zf-HC2 domain-containing protein [Gemmatimonadales bacterium]